jgi:hypothetical protein
LAEEFMQLCSEADESMEAGRLGFSSHLALPEKNSDNKLSSMKSAEQAKENLGQLETSIHFKDETGSLKKAEQRRQSFMRQMKNFSEYAAQSETQGANSLRQSSEDTQKLSKSIFSKLSQRESNDVSTKAHSYKQRSPNITVTSKKIKINKFQGLDNIQEDRLEDLGSPLLQHWSKAQETKKSTRGEQQAPNSDEVKQSLNKSSPIDKAVKEVRAVLQQESFHTRSSAKELTSLNQKSLSNETNCSELKAKDFLVLSAEHLTQLLGEHLQESYRLFERLSLLTKRIKILDQCLSYKPESSAYLAHKVKLFFEKLIVLGKPQKREKKAKKEDKSIQAEVRLLTVDKKYQISLIKETDKGSKKQQEPELENKGVQSTGFKLEEKDQIFVQKDVITWTKEQVDSAKPSSKYKESSRGTTLCGTKADTIPHSHGIKGQRRWKVKQGGLKETSRRVVRQKTQSELKSGKKNLQRKNRFKGEKFALGRNKRKIRSTKMNPRGMSMDMPSAEGQSLTGRAGHIGPNFKIGSEFLSVRYKGNRRFKRSRTVMAGKKRRRKMVEEIDGVELNRGLFKSFKKSSKEIDEELKDFEFCSNLIDF